MNILMKAIITNQLFKGDYVQIFDPSTSRLLKLLWAVAVHHQNLGSRCLKKESSHRPNLALGYLMPKKLPDH